MDFYYYLMMKGGGLSNFITLGVLYLKNSEEMTFEDLSMKVPFYYTRSQDKDSLTLLRFPKVGGIIFLKKEYFLKDVFYEKLKTELYNMHFKMIKEGEI